MRKAAAAVAAALAGIGLLGCVTREQREVSSLRDAHARCLAEHSESHPDCVALRERLNAAQQRYQESSRRAWACDPAQDDCPTRR
jgi:hypothetical protein